MIKKKKPPSQTKEEEKGSLPEKIIQYNDSEGDTKSWKQSGVTYKNTIDMDWEDAKMFNNDLEKIKNQSVIINTILRLKTFWKG